MAEEPEQVLPQYGAAVARVIDVAAEFTVVEHAQCRGEQQWEDHEHDYGGHEDVPAEDGHAEQGHAWGTHGEHGGNHVDGGEHGADTGGAHTNDPHVGADAGRVDGVRQGHVHGPAEVCGATGGEEAREHGDTTDEGDPKTEGVQPGECHVGGADLQWQNVVGEPPHDGGAEEQQHDSAMHREQLVELFVG